MVESLSDFFRTSLNQGKDIISIKEEIQHVRSYLEIQQMRYQDILEYEINVPEEFHQNTIPKITVQPLVENALYHGIKNKRGKGKITVRGYREGSFFILEVQDNGIGMQPERLEQVRNALVHERGKIDVCINNFNIFVKTVDGCIIVDDDMLLSLIHI